MPESTPPPRVEVRDCTVADAETLAIIGAATVLETFAGILPGQALLAHCRKNHRPEAYVGFFRQPATRAWLAEADPGAAPVGYALLTGPDFPAEVIRPGDRELRRIYLLSRFHSTGVGRTMMARAIRAARDQGAGRLLLGVYPHNHRAIAFYRRVGFEQIGTRLFRIGEESYHDPVFALPL